MTQDQTVYSIVITDNQDYWDWRTDYLGTAKNVEQAKQMLKDWIIKHNFSKEGNILDDDLAHSIGIFEQTIGKINNNSENNYISVDINKLINGK